MAVKPRMVTHHCGASRNKWCGPAVVSILAGCTAEEAAESIWQVRPAWRQRNVAGRKMPVKGCWTHEVLQQLSARGFKLTKMQAVQDETLKANLDRLEHYVADGEVLLVVAGDHFSVKERCGRRWIHTCSRTGPTTRAVQARAKVKAIYKVEREV